MNKNIWLIGSGGMAIDYVKVLQALELEFSIIGRGAQSAKACQVATGCDVVSGGLVGYLATKPAAPTHAIVAVGVEKLHETTLQLLDYGVRSILVEKPAGLDKCQIDAVYLKAKQKNAKVFVAYNRRFYASALKAKEIIAEDGGVTSFNFEFTEWAHEIEKLTKAQGVKDHWFLGNSTHVVDLAFYLGGSPKQMSSFTAGSVTWHPTASIFSGAGISKNGSLFSYQANWESAGRWSVEILTRVNRLIFRPMEKLQIQKRGSLDVSLIACNYDIDQVFKPGLYMQTKSFIDGIEECLCDIEYHANIIDIYNQMASYK
jgi:predicted dehydrogenase